MGAHNIGGKCLIWLIKALMDINLSCKMNTEIEAMGEKFFNQLSVSHITPDKFFECSQVGYGI